MQLTLSLVDERNNSYLFNDNVYSSGVLHSSNPSYLNIITLFKQKRLTRHKQKLEFGLKKT